jgi:hypothetical protein
MKNRGTSVTAILLSFSLWLVVELVVPDRVMNIMFVVVASVVLVGVILVAYGTVVRNRWGINLEQVNCPRCQAPVPRVRKPKSRREMLWGGGHCDKCGCEMDKWGSQITT